jgi:hypothetical protein
MSFGLALLCGLALYVIAGLCTAAAFVAFGVTKILAEPMPVSFGARVLIFPGVTALWPYVLLRWLKSGRRP